MCYSRAGAHAEPWRTPNSCWELQALAVLPETVPAVVSMLHLSGVPGAGTAAFLLEEQIFLLHNPLSWPSPADFFQPLICVL